MTSTEVFTGATHFYKEEKCSGTFMYAVDDCKPSYIKFSARITIKVVLDKNTNLTNHTLGESNVVERQTSVYDTHIDDTCETSNKDISVEPVDAASDGQGSNGEDDVTDELIVKKASKVPQSAIQNEKEEPMFSLIKQISHNEEDDLSPDKEYDQLENCSSKYNLRQRKKEPIHIDDSYVGEEDEEEKADSIDTPVTEESSISFCTTQKTDLKKIKGKTQLETKQAKTSTESPHKSVLKVENKRMKNKAVKDRKGKRRMQERENGNAHDSVEIGSDPLDMEKPYQRKQSKSKPKKLLMTQNLKCDYCDVTFFTKIDFYNHRRNKGSVFRCEICGKDEPFEAHLMAHMLSHEPDKGYVDYDGVKKENAVKRRRHKLKCNVCGLVVSSIDSLKVHMILHTGESPYRCCLCKDQAFFSLSSLRHHQEVHKISKRFQCKNCKMRFPSRTELSKHKLTHEIKCGLCGDLFPNKTSRACHYRTSHPNDIKRCTECLGLFSTDEELQKHILYHRKGKKEQCPVCGIVVTKLKDHMVIHATVHGENLFACDQCPMKYTRKSSLNKHLLVHTGEKPYACSRCPKKFRSNGMLRKHLLTHTLERPFVCELCGKQFSLRSNLATHMRIHSETRKYPCSYCLQAFNYKTSLEIHMKCKHSTTDTPPTLSCVNCFQTFQDESSQIAHVCSGYMAEMKTSKEINKDWESLNLPLPEQPFSHEQEKQMSQSQQPQQQQQLSLLQEYPLKDRQEKQKEHDSDPQRQDQSLSFKPNLHLSQDQTLTHRQEYLSLQREPPLPHRPYKPQTVTIGQEPTYISQEPHMMPFLYSNQPCANQTNTGINPHVPMHDSSIHSGLTALDSASNFQMPTPNINFGRGFIPSNMVDEFGRERKSGMNHQSSTISSILSAPPTFRCIPPALEHLPPSINFSNVIPTSCSKDPSETNGTNG